MRSSICRVAPKAYDYVREVLDYGFHNAHSPGFVARVEEQFSRRFGQEFGILHANGTATMQSALMAAGIGVGDEVIVPAYTVFSTAAVALHVNAVPVVADVDSDTWTISVEDVERKLTPRTRGIIPVSICGLAPDMDPIMDLAAQHGLTVIEDNAQCCGGSYRGRIVGSMGQFASFSFQASKTLTCGDGGILICSDEQLATGARRAATLGFSTLTAKPGDTVVSEAQRCHPSFARHTSLGWNQRLPEIAAAVALAELERLDELIEMRQFSGRCFDEVVRDCDWLVPQKTPPGYVHAYWTYGACITDDDADWGQFRAKFVELGGEGFYGAYLPVHLEPVMSDLYEQVKRNPDRYPQFAGRLPQYGPGQCPVWESIQPRVIQLKTNYWSADDARRQADILAKTIRYFS